MIDEIDDHKYPIVMFANEMFQELKKHDTEKSLKFYSMSVEKLLQLLSEEANERLEKLKLFKEGMPLSEIEKNAIHIANYCYFVWSQIRKIKDDTGGKLP